MGVTEPRKILWAIDPFDQTTQPDSLGLRELAGWKAAGFAIVPVHVLTAEQVEGPIDPLRLNHHITGATKAAEHYLSSLQAGFAEAPVVLIDRSPSFQGAVERLLQYASQSSAKLIAVSTRGRAGLSRIILGSFAEALLMRSEVPLLFLSHERRVEKPDLTTAVFATDLSPYSRAAFDEFLDYAAQSDTGITLVHHVTLPRQLEYTSSGIGTLAYLPQRYFDEQEAWAEEEAARWCEAATQRGIRIQAVVTQERGDTSELILRIAKEREAGMIAMASQSGPVAAFLLGSVARGVFRPHHLPVWICGPRFLAARTERDERPRELNARLS
jgi:nucleotide-binding universal stress UspA family protein